MRLQCPEVADVAGQDGLAEASTEKRQMCVDRILRPGLGKELANSSTIAKVRNDIHGLQRSSEISLSRAAPDLGHDGFRGTQNLPRFGGCCHQCSDRAAISISRDQWPCVDDQRKYDRACSSSTSVRDPD